MSSMEAESKGKELKAKRPDIKITKKIVHPISLVCLHTFEVM